MVEGPGQSNAHAPRHQSLTTLMQGPEKQSRAAVRTGQVLKLDEGPSGSKVVLVLVCLAESVGVLGVLVVSLPVLLRAVGRPARVGRVECDEISLAKVLEADGAGGHLLDAFGAHAQVLERRGRERVEQVVLAEDLARGRCVWVGWRGLGGRILVLVGLL